MQFLLKQSTSAVDILSDVFKLTSEEKKRLSQFPVGQGLFFAGQNHVHIQVIASPTETSLITTNPAQVQQINAAHAQAQGAFDQAQGTIDLNNRLYPGSSGVVQ
jgi:conjugal transfer ATP-binding protein TraC